MKQLIYISKIASDISRIDIERILNYSRKNNLEKDITGCLVFNDSYFVQILEGPVDAVDKLYETIAQDNRHFEVEKKYEKATETRLFGEWSMAFIYQGEAALWDAGLIVPTKDFLHLVLSKKMIPSQAWGEFSALYNELLYSAQLSKSSLEEIV